MGPQTMYTATYTVTRTLEYFVHKYKTCKLKFIGTYLKRSSNLTRINIKYLLQLHDACCSDAQFTDWKKQLIITSVTQTIN